MSRSKILKGVADGLLGTFVSRNNDIDGYWGLGVLRLYAEKHLLSTVTVDMLHSLESVKSHSPVEIAEAKYQNWLRNALDKSRVEPSRVIEAKIDLRFSTFDEFPKIVRYTRGQPFVCSVKIVTRNGKVYSATRTGCCEAHDPTKERRSVRDNFAE